MDNTHQYAEASLSFVKNRNEILAQMGGKGQDGKEEKCFVGFPPEPDNTPKKEEGNSDTAKKEPVGVIGERSENHLPVWVAPPKTQK